MGRFARGVVVAIAGLLSIAGLVTVGASPAQAVASTRLLITGDSITHGSSGDYTWRYRLWQKLQSTAPGQVDFVGPTTTVYDNVNHGAPTNNYAVDFPGKAHGAKWGTTFIAELPNIQGQVSASAANTMVVALGYNDLSYFTSPADTIANAREYIRRARVASPGIDVVIAEVTYAFDPWSNTTILQTQTREYADRLVGLQQDLNTANERVEIAHTLDGWDPRAHTWDGVHPNPTGETVIAQRVSEALARMGIGTSGPSIIANTAWNVAGPTPTVDASPEAAVIRWNRTSTGSTGMFIHYKVEQLGTWEKLPYAVGSEDAWEMNPLIAGGDYKFAVSPSKGFSEGVRGPAVARTIDAKPFDRTVSSLTARGVLQGVIGDWGPASNAQSYFLAYQTMAYNSPVYELPYPVSADTRSWELYPLASGRYYQFMVKPNRGFVHGRYRHSPNTRTPGISYGRAYIALGDSYSSGLGAHRDVEQYDLDQPCRRTTAAWAFRMQPDAQVGTRLVACQGDTISGGIDGGVRQQLPLINSFFASHPNAPQLVTVTVGGNDVNFSSKLTACVMRDCTPSEGEWSGQVSALYGPLFNFYNDLRDAAPNADIVVGGYPHLLEVGGKKVNAVCSALTTGERQMIARLTNQLNGVSYSASQGSPRTGTHKTPIWSIGSQAVQQFAGHGACQYGDDEYIHSYTTGGGMVDGVGINSFHPKPSGQIAYAYAFANAIMANS